MLPLPKGAAPKFILLFLVSLLIKEISSEGRVVCYYTNWSVYRPGTAKFNPQNINPYLCTHLIYAFGGFTKDNTLKPFDKYQDIEQGGYSKFTGLKAYNKNLKTLLAIGGWNEGSSRFSPLVANSERRQQFIKNILKFLRQNHFDGLDLDWEYPAFRDGGKLRDKENYAQFVQELRSEFDRESSKTGRPRLLLTMAVPAGTEYIEKGYDIPKLNKYLDWFNLLSYDYHSAYEPSVNHHSPLYSLEEESEYNYDADLNIDYSVKFYLQAGADRDKIVLGIPTYGRTYTLVSEDITELGSPADGPGDQGDATREKGYLAYYEICQNLRDDPDWTIVQPNTKAMGPYAFRGNQWVGYDDEAIVKKKAEYVVENGLGGIMFWSIDNDDFRGSCGNKPYPLIEAAKEAMLEHLGVGDNEVARPSPPRKPSRSRSRQGSSNRNNIISENSTHKAIQSGKKSSSRRNSNKKRLNRVTSTTTTTTTTTTPSSLYIGGRSTTPPPPTTPDPGADFKCEEEGFFPHPRDCKKYFWCLDSGPSNLGIVAHQFTCPSGLYFNTAADSCDFSRNVLCKTKTTTAKPTTTAPITSTTTTTTTTNSPRITAATSRQTFLRYSSTTEQPSEEEYDDEEDDESRQEEEEDPKVIKELIQLIKKVGGLEELEKQLLQQEDGSMVLPNSKSDVSSTTPSTISKSLYHKVLSRPNNLSSFRRQFQTNKLTRSTVSPVLKEEEESVETEEVSEKTDSKYSSVVRNSRPSPQNAGIDKLPEFEGFLKEKPKYVTIQRTRPTVAVESNSDDEENEDVSTEFAEQSTRDSKNRRVDTSFTQTTTATPSYVNIRRTRPSTTAPETSEVTEEEKVISSTRSSYQPLNRRRISTTVTTATDEITTPPSTASVLASTTQRYKYIERTKSSTIQPEEIKTTTGFIKSTSFSVDENSAPITVQNLELNDYTTQAPIQKIATTHIYENIARRTTLSTTPSTTLVETTTAEPTTIRAFTTTNPTITTISSSTNSAPLLIQDPNPVDNFQNQNLILPITDPNPNKSTGLDTDGKDTTELTDKKTDSIHQIGEDEVTLTDSKVKVSSSSTLSSYNITKFNEFESSLKATNPSLSKIEKQVTVTSTDILTTPNTDATTIQTTTQKDEITTKDFLETVSSPRPFGFPRRRTRPTTARKPSSTTNHEIVTSTSTVTPPPTQKVSPLKQLKSNSRTTSRYQSRTYVEDVSSASNNARELNEVGKGNLHTSQNPPKRPLSTYSYSGENADDELDNNISSRKRSYSWKSQVNRNYRPWKTTTTVGTTPTPIIGPDRSYRPQYDDERDNLETDDSYAYKSYRDETESNSYKSRQFERTRGNVRTSSEDATSQRRIGVRLQNQSGNIDESEDAQRSNRRYEGHGENESADSNSYRRKFHRVQSKSDSSNNSENIERNGSHSETSSEDITLKKRIGVRLQNQDVTEDDQSQEVERGNRRYGAHTENQSTDSNAYNRKSYRIQLKSGLSLSNQDNTNSGQTRGNSQISSNNYLSQRRLGVRLRNSNVALDKSEETQKTNGRNGIQSENQVTDNSSYLHKSYRVESESDSSVSSKDESNSVKHRDDLQTSLENNEFQNTTKYQSDSSLPIKEDASSEKSHSNVQISSTDETYKTSDEDTVLGKRIGNQKSSIYGSEKIRISNRRYGTQINQDESNDNSDQHKSNRVFSNSDLSSSTKEESVHGNHRTLTENLSQRRIGVKLKNTTTIIHESENSQINNRRYSAQNGDETQTSNTNAIKDKTVTTHKGGDQLSLHAGFTVGDSRVSSIENAKTTNDIAHTSINASELIRKDNAVTDSVTNESNEEGAVRHTSSERFSNTNVKQISEEGINFSGKGDVRRYFTSPGDDRNTIAALHQGKIKLGNQDKSTFVRNKATVSLYKNSNSGKDSTQSEFYEENHSTKLEEGNRRLTSNITDENREQSILNQSGVRTEIVKQTIEEQNGSNIPRRRVVVKKRIYRTRNNNTSELPTGGKGDFSSTNVNIVSGRRTYEQRRKLGLEGNSQNVEDTKKLRTTNLSNRRIISEDSISKSNKDTSVNLLNKNIEETENGVVEQGANVLSETDNTSRRRIQTFRNSGTTSNNRFNNSARRRIVSTEENTEARNFQTKENTDTQNIEVKENAVISENVERNEFRRRQRIRPTRPPGVGTSPPERRTRPNTENDLSSLLAVDRNRWEFIDRTKMPGGGTMVRRRRPLVKATTEIPTEPETTKPINRRVRPPTLSTQSTNTLRQRNQYLYRNKGSQSLNKTDEEISVNTQSERSSFRTTSGDNKEGENFKTKIVGSTFTKNSVSDDRSAQNDLLEKSKISEESFLVKTSTKGSESSSNVAGNKRITTNSNNFDEETSEVDSRGEILSFEESQNGSFRGRSQNAIQSSTLYTLKTNKGVIQSGSLRSTTQAPEQATSIKSEEEWTTSSSTLSSDDITTVIPEIETMATTEESSTVPQTTLYDLLSDKDVTGFTTTIGTPTTMDILTTTDTPTVTDAPTTMDSEITEIPTTTYTPTGMDTTPITDKQATMEEETTLKSQTTIQPQTTMEEETTFGSQTTIQPQTIIDSFTTTDKQSSMHSSTTIDSVTEMGTTTAMNFESTINTEAMDELTTLNPIDVTTPLVELSTITEEPTSTLSDLTTGRNFRSSLKREQLNTGERFVSRSSEKGKTLRSFQSTRQQNTFQSENDFKDQSVNINRKFGTNSARTSSQKNDDVQQLLGKDGVEILYHRQKYWETFNKSRSHEGDSPIIYIGTFGSGGYKPGRTGKFSPSEIEQIQEIFSSHQETESFSEDSKNINRGNTKFSNSRNQQNTADGLDERKEIRLTTGKEYKRTGIKDNSRELTRSQGFKAGYGRGKSLSSGNLQKTTETSNFATTQGNEEYAATTLNAEYTTINADNIDITTPQTIENTYEASSTIAENISEQTTDFGLFDQEKEFLTSTIPFDEEVTTFPSITPTTDKTTNALDKTGLSAFENNFSTTTDGFVETTTNSNLSFSEKSQKLAKSSSETSKFNSGGFSRSRIRISSNQQGSSRRTNAVLSDDINEIDLNLKVNVSKESAVSSNSVESNKFKTRTSSVLSKTNSIQISQNSEESTETGLKFSEGRYKSNTGRNLRVSNFQTNRRQFVPFSKRKQSSSSAESTESTIIETSTDSTSTPVGVEGTTIRNTLIFLKGPRPDGRYAEEHGQDIISRFQKGSSYSSSSGSFNSEKTTENHEEGSIYSTDILKDQTTNFKEGDSIYTATENEHDRDEDVKIDDKNENVKDEVSTIRSTLIFLKGPKPFQTTEEVSTISGIEDNTDFHKEATTDSSEKITPTRRTYLSSNRSKISSATSDDSSIIKTDQENEDRISTLSYRIQQTSVQGSAIEGHEETTEDLKTTINKSENEESENSDESDLSLNNRGTIKKIYSTINRDRVKRPLQSSSESETTSEVNATEEISTVSPSTTTPSQEKPTLRRYNPSIRFRSTTTSPESISEETEQNLQSTTEKNESVRKYSSFKRKNSFQQSASRTSRISSQNESKNLKTEGGSVDSSEERIVDTSEENDLENNASKNRTTYSRRNFSNRFQSGKERNQRTRSYGSVKFNDVTEIDNVDTKTYSSINRSATSKITDRIGKSEESSTVAESSIPSTEAIEFTTFMAEIDDATTEASNNENSEKPTIETDVTQVDINDATTEVSSDENFEKSTKESVVTQATTTEFEEKSTTTEEDTENFTNGKTTTLQTEKISLKTNIEAGKSTEVNKQQDTASITDDKKLSISSNINSNLSEEDSHKTSQESTSTDTKEVTSNIRERTRLRFNRVRTIDNVKSFENTVNKSSKGFEALQKQSISSSSQGSQESNKYRISGLRNLYGTNTRRKFTNLKQKQLTEESATASSLEEIVTDPGSVENDLFVSSPTPDSLVTESATNFNFNLDNNEKIDSKDDFTTLKTLSVTSEDKEDEDEFTTFDPNFSTTKDSSILNKEDENEIGITVTTNGDFLDETTIPTITKENEELNTTQESIQKQISETEDTTKTIATKRTFIGARKFGNSRIKSESAVKIESNASKEEESNERITSTGRTYPGLGRNRLLFKTNRRVNEETTGSGSAATNGDSSITEYRKRYGTYSSSRSKSVQTSLKNEEAIDQKSAPAYSFSTRTRSKFLNRQDLEKSANAEQNELSDTQGKTVNEENSLSQEVVQVENKDNEETISTNDDIALNTEEESSTITSIKIDENHTELSEEFQANNSESLKENQNEGTETLDKVDVKNLDAENNSSSSASTNENVKNQFVRPLPYLKNKSIFLNREITLKTAQKTFGKDESNISINQDVVQESKEESADITNENENNVTESEEISKTQSAKPISQLKFQRKPFPLSRNLPKTLLEKSTNVNKSEESNLEEDSKNFNIESNQQESSVTNLSQEITELHATLNDEHIPDILDSTNSTALNVNNSANNGLVREDSNLSALNTETSNPLKFNRRFQKISSGNRFQITNNQNTESTVRTVNGRRVRVLKFRKPSINTIADNEGKVNVSTSQRPFVRKFFRKRPSAIATTLSDTEDSIENSEKLNEAKVPSTRKFRKILVRKTPVFQENTEEELQELQVNTTENSFIPVESSAGKTHLLKIQKPNEDLADLDLQNENVTDVTPSVNITSSTIENEDNDSFNITSITSEIVENEFNDTEINTTSVEALEKIGDENTNTTESGEQNINTESVETTASTSTTKNKLFASRRPYKPTKPSISAITSTEATSVTTKTYVRKYSSNFKIPKPPSEINTNAGGANDENGEVFIRPLSSFIKNRPTLRNRIKSLDDENEEDADFEDEEVEKEDLLEKNEEEHHNDRDDYITESVEDIKDEKTEPEVIPISKPPILQSFNRLNSKSSGIPNLIIRLNNGFDSQSEKSELEVVPHSSEESTDEVSASYEDEDEANFDETSEDEFQSTENVDLPIPSNTPLLQTTKATPIINHPGFIPKRPPSNKPRVINRPTFTTVHPASLKFRVTSPLASTPPSFKTNNTRSYERKYLPTSTEPTSQDNSLLEDLNIDALNARNKKIFEINSRKHTTVKPKISGGKQNTVDSETTFNISHNVEQINATTNEILNNFDHLQENVLENVISPPTTTRRPPPSTTTTKMTTLYHIFALSAEDDATTENNNGEEIVPSERREKLVEINRVVEVYSKEDKLKKSKKNEAEKIESSQLKLEKNATLEKLGEIGRVTFVKLVESNGGKAKSLEDGGELVIEGRSTVADYTPTEPIPASSESGPVRNVIPVIDGTDQSEQKKDGRKLQLPEVILGVETSTIPLEGLFETPRKSKELPASDEPVFASSLGEVFAMKSEETSSVAPTVATTSLPVVSTPETSTSPETTTELPSSAAPEVKTEKPQTYIRPLVPLLRPESNESSPLVISIANLDKVILSKVPRSDSSVASSGRISTFVEPPKSINLLDDASLSKVKTATSSSSSSSQSRNETVVQTQTSFSSEIQVVRKKLPRRSKSTRRRKAKIEEEQTN